MWIVHGNYGVLMDIICDSPAQNFRFPVLKISTIDEESATREGVGIEICIEILGCSWIWKTHRHTDRTFFLYNRCFQTLIYDIYENKKVQLLFISKL